MNGGLGDDYIIAQGGDYATFADGIFPIVVCNDQHVDTLNGGDANDTLIATNGGVLTGGADEDVFAINQNTRYIGDETYAGSDRNDLIPDPIIITDYDPDEEVIVIALLGDFAGFSGPPSDQVTVQVREDGQGSDILISGWVIATVIGNDTLTYEELRFDRELTRPQ